MRSAAITSVVVDLLGPIEAEVEKATDGLVRVRIGSIAFHHDLAEWRKAISEIGLALDRIAQGDHLDVNALSGEHPATGGE